MVLESIQCNNIDSFKGAVHGSTNIDDSLLIFEIRLFLHNSAIKLMLILALDLLLDTIMVIINLRCKYLSILLIQGVPVLDQVAVREEAVLALDYQVLLF